MECGVIGFPRIGEHRELKYATEKYFKKEITEGEFLKIIEEEKKKEWEKENKAGIKYISSNDYSLYDMMLDTIVLLSALPKRYKDLSLSKLDAYFAAARGYQGDNGDVKALSMRKWFNTNYHYLVPELDDDTSIKLNVDDLFADYKKALALGIKTKPVFIGPFTFIKLAKCLGKRNKLIFIGDLIDAYASLLKEATKIGIEWLEIDEPYLVMDLSSADIEIFKNIYSEVLKQKGNTKIILQTYFGDIRDAYSTVCSLDFDAIGLDFVEGKLTKGMILANGFPQNKILFAGLINGKNIWRANYKEVIDNICWLKKYCHNIVLNTSCSLLHVPYTILNENKLDKDVLKHFAFAYEKLDELKEICELLKLDYKTNEKYLNNQSLFEKNDLRLDEEVRNKVASLKESDFKRSIPRVRRLEIQRKILGLPLIPTTTIGSFPQTKEVKNNRSLFKKGLISEEEYKKNIFKFIDECIKIQEEIGLDVLVHGEFERNDMVEFFGENLEGYVFSQNGWVQSYGTRGVKPPIIFGDIKRKKSITSEYITYANSLTKKDVKGMLTGPVTILNWSFPREDISIRDMMYQIGLAIREEVLELESKGVRIIQIDEAALREKLPLRKSDGHIDYLDFAIKAFRLTHSMCKAETQIHTHMCYSEFEDIIKEIDDMDADVITFEASRSNLHILDSLKENNFQTEVGPGVYDIHSPRVPKEEEIEKALEEMLKRIPVENLWANPDCGLKTRGWIEVKESLTNMVLATKKIRERL